MTARNRIMIIIGGSAGHGKNTLAELLRDTYDQWVDVREDAYALTLKKLVHEALGVPWHVLLADKATKESTLVSLCSREEITVRQALQDVREWFRQRFGYLIWANSVKNRAQHALERVTLVTDARHPKEEIHWMREQCSEFARVFVVRIRRSSVPIVRGHPSEDLIADEPDTSFDFIIENEGSIDELRVAAAELAHACAYLTKTGRKKIKRRGDGWINIDDSSTDRYEPLTDEEVDIYKSQGEQVKKLTYFSLTGSACQ